MTADDAADVAIKPPLLFLGALALGCLMSLIVPLGPRLASPNGNALAVGFTFIAFGFVLAGMSARALRRAGTEIVPGRPASALVTTGPYRITRNPIYIGLTLVYFGLSIVMTSLWVLLLLIPTLMILQHGIVMPEEAYLKRRFGAPYRKYQAHVPRWL
ncbi:isoprenylcysteine carboxylmethyltransferase family protein [Methyloceanibacter sp.]|uniref:methyltransferase family protein n=1 Tax=Methyloceanibacter sp. TaxID=1965321 RepID=UPI002D58BB04|nr:isoprenylcysteine carboxylmethyltransferase family protein [Methyloceanibacter sp.]HZP10107.1 isoprenylcysteine carboxylmethyltransferase family protein [Methyloceanibacter sp.]